MQRSDESERSVDDILAEVNQLTDEEDSRTASDRQPSASTDSRTGSVRARLGGLFSARTFLLAFVLSAVGVVVGGSVPLVGFLGRLVGLFLAAFVIGLLASERRYLEVAFAGALASGLGFVLSALTSAFFPFAVNLLAEYGIAIAGVGAGVGAFASLVGHYFGRDLRDGLTREV